MSNARPLELRPVLVNEDEVDTARVALRTHADLGASASRSPYLSPAEAELLRSIVAQYDQGGVRARAHD